MREKYSKITFKILLCIPLLIGLLFVDKLVLPQKTINDEIIAYGKIFVSGGRNQFSSTSTKVFAGYRFFKQKGFEFSIDRKFIDENDITIKQSYIFKNITSVKSKTEDYSDKLMSGLNGACMYFTVGLLISAIISLLHLKFNKRLSENGFQNIILMNSFMVICTLYLFR